MIYTIAAEKGGTGKTATAAALTQIAAHDGGRVLAVDLDPRGDLSYILEADATQPGSYELLHGAPARDLLQHSPQGMDVITATRALNAEASREASARRLAAALAPIRDSYDYIFIDTPANGNELQLNALQAADRLIIVLEADRSSLQALYFMEQTATQIKKSNPALEICGAIIGRYAKGNAVINNYLLEQIEQTAAGLHIPFLGVARDSSGAKEALNMAQSLIEYAPRTTTAADYKRIYKAITK